MTLHVHRNAAVRKPRKTRRTERVTATQVPAIGRAEALRLAGGDKTRLRVTGPAEIIVENRPRRTQ